MGVCCVMYRKGDSNSLTKQLREALGKTAIGTWVGRATQTARPPGISVKAVCVCESRGISPLTLLTKEPDAVRVEGRGCLLVGVHPPLRPACLCQPPPGGGQPQQPPTKQGPCRAAPSGQVQRRWVCFRMLACVLRARLSLQRSCLVVAGWQCPFPALTALLSSDAIWDSRPLSYGSAAAGQLWHTIRSGGLHARGEEPARGEQGLEL